MNRSGIELGILFFLVFLGPVGAEDDLDVLAIHIELDDVPVLWQCLSRPREDGLGCHRDRPNATAKLSGADPRELDSPEAEFFERGTYAGTDLCQSVERSALR